MGKAVSFQNFIKKVGAAKARNVYLEKLSKEEIGKLSFEDWSDIYFEANASFSHGCGETEARNQIIVKKMIEKAEGIEQALRAYQKTQDGSQEERMALEKLSSFSYPDEWIKMFGQGNQIHLNRKGLAYLKEKVEDLIEFP